MSRKPTNNEILNPSSKKIIQKMKSVTGIRKLFIPKNQVRKKLENENENKQTEEHALYLTHNQNWRQKLERFQPDKS